MIVNPSDLDQSKNDQIVPTDLVPVNELQDNSEQAKKGNSMTWIIPLLGAVVGMGVVGGIIWYSMKKEEEFGLIGKYGSLSTRESSHTIPQEVKKIYEAVRKNAKSIGDPDRAYAGRNIENGKVAWIIGDNYDRMDISLVYKDGSWYYRSSFVGGDKLMKNGYLEALSNANVFFTG